MNIIYNFGWAKEILLMPGQGNRAFQYGDGLFETIIYKHGQIRFLQDHYTRLVNGINAFQMQVPPAFSYAYLEEQIHQLVEANTQGTDARVRVHVWRKPGGTYTPMHNEIEFCITAQPLAAPAPSVKGKAFFYEDIKLVASPLSRFKTCNSLPYVMAGIAMTQRGANDMILLDVYGHIAECIASTIFWINENVLYTPSLESGCIEGIMRKQVLLKARELHISVQEGLFTKQDLLSAETLFCCNVAGMQTIRQVEERVFGEGYPAFAELFDLF
jgi:branched-chain amino acid aminotransferase/4-amino-4-deoxychorismate lyase